MRLTSLVRKNDIVSQLIGMAKIEATHRPVDDEANSEASLSIEEIKQVLRKLPAFPDVVEWGKRIGGILNDFTLLNVTVYLVYGQDKSFDMQSLLALNL